MATTASSCAPAARRKLFTPKMESCWYACKTFKRTLRSRRKINYKPDYDQSQLPKHVRIINLKASRAQVPNKWVSPQFDRKSLLISRRKRIKLMNRYSKASRSSSKLPASRSCKPKTSSSLSLPFSRDRNSNPILNTTFDPNLSSSQYQQTNTDNCHLSPIKSDYSDNSFQSCSITTPPTIIQGNTSNGAILVPTTPLSSYKDRWVARSKLNHDYI